MAGLLDRLRGRPASLAQALARFAQKGQPAEWDSLLDPFEDESVAGEDDARALAQALASVPQWPLDAQRYADGGWSQPLHAMLAYFQEVESEAGAQALTAHALPQVRRLVDDGLQRPGADIGTLVFAFKQLVLFHQPEDTARVLAGLHSAVHPALADEYFWATALSGYDAGHPQAEDFFRRVAGQLPHAFSAIALLDAVNAYWRAQDSLPAVPHPFDSPQGLALLHGWLQDPDPEHHSYGHSATAALPFLQHADAPGLFDLATRHPDGGVRLEAAWASLHAQRGDEAAARALLVSACESPVTHVSAAGYLEELGLDELVPTATRGDDFQALAEMALWLQHPHEFGAAPDELACTHTQELFWPPTEDRRTLRVMRYVYRGRNEDGSDDIGHGLVGSVTFALFGETDQAGASALEVLASHCGWEMSVEEEHPEFKDLGPEQRRAAGLRLLRQHNPDLP